MEHGTGTVPLKSHSDHFNLARVLHSGSNHNGSKIKTNKVVGIGYF
jgi:hypothetical protein